MLTLLSSHWRTLNSNQTAYSDVGLTSLKQDVDTLSLPTVGGSVHGGPLLRVLYITYNTNLNDTLPNHMCKFPHKPKMDIC